MNKKKSALALLVLTAITFYGIRDAFGELVFEDDLSPPSQDASNEINKKNLDVISKMDNGEDGPEESELVYTARNPKVVEEKQPRSDLSRSESMRRQRMRAEVQNEDKLSEKLEELRLKDEMNRVNQLIGTSATDPAPLPIASAVQKTDSLQEEKIGSASQLKSVSQAEMKVEVDTKKEEADDFYKNRFSIMPRGGVASIADSKFEVTSKYALGLTVGVDVSDYFTVDAGYTYAAYNLSAGNAFYYSPYYGSGLQTLNLNQSIIDLGLRVNVLGNKYRVRPFVTGGAGYYRSAVSLDERTLAIVRQYNPSLAGDSIVSGFTGYVGAGVEFRLTRALSLTGMFKYYNVVSASQSSPISSAAFMNSAGDSRQQASEYLARNNFYSVMGGISLSF